MVNVVYVTAYAFVSPEYKTTILGSIYIFALFTCACAHTQSKQNWNRITWIFSFM